MNNSKDALIVLTIPLLFIVIFLTLVFYFFPGEEDFKYAKLHQEIRKEELRIAIAKEEELLKKLKETK